MQTTTFVDEHPYLFWSIIAYIVISGLLLYATIRRPIIGWYSRQVWLVSGEGVIDIMLKQIGMRLTVELLAFLIACVLGSLGGNIYVIRKARRNSDEIEK